MTSLVDLLIAMQAINDSYEEHGDKERHRNEMVEAMLWYIGTPVIDQEYMRLDPDAMERAGEAQRKKIEELGITFA